MEAFISDDLNMQVLPNKYRMDDRWREAQAGQNGGKYKRWESSVMTYTCRRYLINIEWMIDVVRRKQGKMVANTKGGNIQHF